MRIEVEEKCIDICIIIPTYNNEKTLARIIEQVCRYATTIIVVNDGSTDTTQTILNTFENIVPIHFKTNQGKGKALQAGFKKAIELGFSYAITIDSDGQHFPEDIPIFVQEIKQSTTPILLIGSRNMEQEGIPKKSSFGNKFSNFWFWFETGIKLEDTQSGYRAYPLKSLSKNYFTKKFEFEIESIVRLAWKGVSVKNIPINISYNPAERVTHFRPFKDFTRISILNIVLVIITLLYIKPRDFLRSFKKKSFRSFIKEDLLAQDDSNSKLAISLALGVFVGIAPLWGFQTLIVMTLAVFLNQNKALAFVGSNISIPPMIPLIIYGSLQVGGVFIPSKTTLLSNNTFTFETISNHLTQYIVGSLLLASLVSLCVGGITYVALLFLRNRTETK